MLSHTRQGSPKTVSALLLYPSLAFPILRFVSNREYRGSFGTVSWASLEFEPTTGNVTANMERNVSRHHTELYRLTMSSAGYSSSPVHCIRWLAFILAWPQKGQASSEARPNKCWYTPKKSCPVIRRKRATT
ncbi:hypothetical protein TNCV_1076121 [Trichonephila clavipes]|nr:hypothetical protein TNCV_1076121 [Trichonephila clavipes]